MGRVNMYRYGGLGHILPETIIKNKDLSLMDKVVWFEFMQMGLYSYDIDSVSSQISDNIKESIKEIKKSLKKLDSMNLIDLDFDLGNLIGRLNSCDGKSLPNDRPGVYVISYICRGGSNKQKIAYVGSSHNIMKRVLGRNHVFSKLRKMKCFDVGVQYIVEENYVLMERFLIRKLKPILNKNGK